MEIGKCYEPRPWFSSQRAGLPAQLHSKMRKTVCHSFLEKMRKTHRFVPLVLKLNYACFLEYTLFFFFSRKNKKQLWAKYGWLEIIMWFPDTRAVRTWVTPPPFPWRLRFGQEILPRECKTLQTLGILNHRFHCHHFRGLFTLQKLWGGNMKFS